MIQPIRRTGRYAIGDDYPVGTEISTQDFAVAVLDELESPTHIGRRFTVAAVEADQSISA
jgi:putative NADH-flavin reductase